MNEKHPWVNQDSSTDPLAQKSDVLTSVLSGHLGLVRLRFSLLLLIQLSSEIAMEVSPVTRILADLRIYPLSIYYPLSFLSLHTFQALIPRHHVRLILTLQSALPLCQAG
jgi:hypothetical protein